MNCSKCGYSFAGKFCPSCGVKAGQRKWAEKLKERKLLLSLGGVVLTLALVTVIIFSLSTPQRTVMNYLNAAIAGNASKAITYWDPAMVQELAIMYGITQEELAEMMFDSMDLGDTISFKIESASHSGNKATVLVRFIMTYHEWGEQEEFTDIFYLSRKGIKWYITD